MMFWLFNEKSITPGQFYAMPIGEKIVIRAFANKIFERRKG